MYLEGNPDMCQNLHFGVPNHPILGYPGDAQNHPFECWEGNQAIPLMFQSLIRTPIACQAMRKTTQSASRVQKG